jgi:hypothetical protein
MSKGFLCIWFEKGTSEQIATACPECALDGGGTITAFDA